MKLKKNLLLWNYWANLNQTVEMILRWSPFKIVSLSAVLYPRWPPLLKIEISSNGQDYSILSQKVPKYELYKHNDELVNIYYGIFYELWTFVDFDRLCKLEKRGMELKKNLLLWNYWANLNQTLLKWSSENALPNGAKLGRKHLCKVLYKVSLFHSVWSTNMAAKSNSCFWLAKVEQIFSSETPWPN